MKLQRAERPLRLHDRIVTAAWLVLVAFASTLAAPAADDRSEPSRPDSLVPVALGWETEPAMDYGGRTVAALHAGGTGLLRRIGSLDRAVWAKPVLELPLGLLAMLAQHEVNGHGARAREFDLEPSYGLGLDLSAFTTIDAVPRTNEQNTLLASGGTEATGVLSRRVLTRLYSPRGAPGAEAALQLLTKLDLTLYVSQTSSPEPGTQDGDFGDQYETGNDIAIWLVSRQAQRRERSSPAEAALANPEDVWDRDYLAVLDFDDRRLEDDYDDARIAALWNLLDPATVSAAWAYFDDYLTPGAETLRPFTLKLGRVGMMLGTRAWLGPAEVSRILDVYAVGERLTATAYLRDIDSSVDRTWGYGAGVHGLEFGGRVRLGLELDFWNEPRAAENDREGSAWHAAAELDWMITPRYGLNLRYGDKSEGFLAGRPIESGPYLGAALLVAF